MSIFCYYNIGYEKLIKKYNLIGINMKYSNLQVCKMVLSLLLSLNFSNSSHLHCMTESQLNIDQKISQLQKKLEDFATDLFTNQVHISQKKLNKKITKFIAKYNDICWDFDSKTDDYNRILAMKKVIEDIIKFKDNHL